MDTSLCADCGGRYASTGIDVASTMQQAFQVLLQHPRALAALATGGMVLGLATLPLNLALARAQEQAATQPFAALFSMFPAWVGLMLAGSVYSAVVYSIFIRFLGDALEGRERPVGELVREGLGRVLPMLGLNLLLAIILGIGFMLCFVPGIFLMVALALAIPAVVLQPVGPIEALSLSWERTDGHRWNIFFLVLIGGAIFMCLAMFSGLVSLITRSLGTVGMMVGTVMSQVITTPGIALFLSISVILYLRLSGRWTPGNESR